MYVAQFDIAYVNIRLFSSWLSITMTNPGYPNPTFSDYKSWQPGCAMSNGTYGGAVLSGAAVRVMGLDRVLPFPPLVHHAVGGVGFDYYCRRSATTPDERMAKLAAAGAVGGILAGMLVR